MLGLATGSTPIKVYEELVRMHKEEGLSFRNVVTFNLDEYYPMAREANHSYWRFMHEYLFDHVDIKPENIFLVEKDGVADFVKVLDFGIAKMAAEDREVQDFHTRTGTMIGNLDLETGQVSAQVVEDAIAVDRARRIARIEGNHGAQMIERGGQQFAHAPFPRFTSAHKVELMP